MAGHAQAHRHAGYTGRRLILQCVQICLCINSEFFINPQPTNQCEGSCFAPKLATLHQLHWHASAVLPRWAASLPGSASLARSGMKFLILGSVGRRVATTCLCGIPRAQPP